MNKRIKKQFWLSPKDAEELKRKAELAGLTETAVVRLLIRDIEATFLRPAESKLKWK